MAIKSIDWFPGITLPLGLNDEETFEVDMGFIADGSTVADATVTPTNMHVVSGSVTFTSLGLVTFTVNASTTVQDAVGGSEIAVQVVMPGRGRITRDIKFEID